MSNRKDIAEKIIALADSLELENHARDDFFEAIKDVIEKLNAEAVKETEAGENLNEYNSTAALFDGVWEYD